MGCASSHRQSLCVSWQMCFCAALLTAGCGRRAQEKKQLQMEVEELTRRHRRECNALQEQLADADAQLEAKTTELAETKKVLKLAKAEVEEATLRLKDQHAVQRRLVSSSPVGGVGLRSVVLC